MVKVLFVCMGNICRSPTAEGVFRHKLRAVDLLNEIHVDSAGTHAYHIGKPPDPRSQQAASRRGVDLTALRARRVTSKDFLEFDYVLAMDEENMANLRTICPQGEEYKLRLFLEFAPHLPHREVPDPYYGGEVGFEQVLDLVDEAAEGLLEDIRRRHFKKL